MFIRIQLLEKLFQQKHSQEEAWEKAEVHFYDVCMVEEQVQQESQPKF